MEDFAHRETDGLINDLNKKLDVIYSQASSEMEEKVNTYFKKFEAKDQMKFQQFQSGQITKEEYNDWQLGQIQIGKRWDEMRKTLAHDLNNTNNIAVDLINGYAPTSYALNHNYATFQVERDSLVDTSYSLYSHRTVENLVKDNPDLLPEWKIDEKKDYNWNYKRANNAIVQGVLQGESLKDVSKRFSKDLCGSNKALMNTFARTGMTGAQNRGRMDAYKRAKELGMDMKKVWLATLDGRTRHSHRNLDGETIDIDKAFSNKCDYPGDPHGPAHEVYNCRCTLLCQPKGIDYNVSDLTSRNNKLKGMSYNEWKNKHKKDLDEALPDSMISNAWSGKKYSYVYNLMKNSDNPGHGADATNFFNALKDLGQEKGIGNPPKVWTAYLNGELDDTDIIKIESVIKKYAGEMVTDNDITDTAKAVKAADNISDTISDKAQKELDKLTIKAGKTMDKDEADNYKVNPLYNKDDYGTTHNCQTSTFTYECRRQGYDVVALPKYVDKDNNPLKGYEDIGIAQKTLAKDQSLGWINKKTGQPPKMLYGGNLSIDNVEKIIGTNGERYSMSVRWKKGGAHVVNIERDGKGIIRVIDNQRGPLEKNTWTLKEYFQKDIKDIKAIHRLDDCVPNSEYFNLIVKYNTSKIKTATKIKSVDKEKTIDILGKKFTKDELFKMDDDNLWETLSIIKDESWLEKFDGPNFKKNVLNELFDIEDIAPEVESVFGNKSMSAVFKELQDKGYSNEFYNKVLKPIGKPDGLKQSEVWKKYVSSELSDSDAAKIDEFLLKYLGKDKSDEIIDTDVDDLIKINKSTSIITKAENGLDMDLIKTKSASGVWKELNQAKAGGGKFWNELTDLANKYDEKPGEFWKKYYLTGKLDSDENDILEKYLVKLYAKNGDNDKIDIDLPTNQIKFIDDISEKDFNLAEELDDKIFSLSVKNKISEQELWDKYLKGEFIDSDLDDLIKKAGYKIPDKIPATDNTDYIIKAVKKYVDDSAGIDAGDSLQDIVDTFFDYLGDDDFLDIVESKSGPSDPAKYFGKYLKGEIKDNDLDKLFGIAKTTDKVEDVLDKTNIPYDFNKMDDKTYDDIFNLLMKKNINNQNQYYEDWYNGLIDDSDLDAYFKIGKTTTKVDDTSTTPQIDFDLLKTKKVSTILNEIKTQDGTDHGWWKLIENIGKFYNEKPSKIWDLYLKGQLKDKDEIEDFLKKHYFKEKTDDLLELKKSLPKNSYIDALNTFDDDVAEKIWDYVGDELAVKYKKGPNEIWQKYLSGEIKDDKLDNILKSTITKSNKPDIPEIDYDKFGGKDMYNILHQYDNFEDYEKHGGLDANKINKAFNYDDDKIKELFDEIEEIKKVEKEAEYKASMAKIQAKTTKSEDLIKAEAKLKKAEDKLEAAKEELKKNVDTSVKWKGIWQDDVTLDDYAEKKSTIAAKKQFYYDKIEELEHELDDPDSWALKKYGGEAGINKKIAEFEKYIDDLKEYEQLGQYSEKYYDAIAKAEKAVNKAQKEVNGLQPVGAAFTQERKDAAVWAINKTTDYDRVDKIFDTHARDVYKTMLAREKDALMDYTSASGPYNKPLVGFDSPNGSGSTGWTKKYFIGPDKLSIDKRGRGDKIRALTDLIEKSKYDFDFWMQSSQHYATLEGALDIPYDTLATMSEKELQQFVNIEFELPQFMSGAINKGGGSYNPGNVRFNIYVPEGSEALYCLENTTHGKYEHEIILQRGGKYKITKIYRGYDYINDEDCLFVDMELHSELGYNKFQQTK